MIGNKIANKIIESFTNNNNNKFKIKIINLSDKKIDDGITKFERNLPQNDSKTVTNLNDKKYLKKDTYLEKNDKNLFIFLD